VEIEVIWALAEEKWDIKFKKLNLTNQFSEKGLKIDRESKKL
jgi:hypothetical protein